MAQYEKLILNALLDSYENSLLFKGENKRKQSIGFLVNKKNLPQYFDESSLEYETIHAAVGQLAEEGLLSLVWKKGKEGHILEKLVLNPEHMKDAYAYIKRQPKADMLAKILRVLQEEKEKYQTPVCQSFLDWLLVRLNAQQSVKEYIAIENIAETKQFLLGISAVEQNKNSCYIREFSIAVFGDSKRFEQFSGKIAKVFRIFGSGFAEKEEAEIFAEYGIYHTPNYVYLKGELTIQVGEAKIPLGAFRQGLGISGEDISGIQLKEYTKVKSVITIENLTTFFRWQEEGALLVYLGGYHNQLRRRLLKTIYAALPQAEYLHFGDIDAGGFEIYKDLKRKTEIPFQRYYMDTETLQCYEAYGKKLTKNDRLRLEKLKQEPEFAQVAAYMLEKDVKLEQECVKT